MNLITALIFFIILTASPQLSENYFQACWDIELRDEDMFCYGAVDWKIDEDTYYN